MTAGRLADFRAFEGAARRADPVTGPLLAEAARRVGPALLRLAMEPIVLRGHWGCQARVDGKPCIADATLRNYSGLSVTEACSFEKSPGFKAVFRWI